MKNTTETQSISIWTALALGLLVLAVMAACTSEDEVLHEYQIVVNGSVSPESVQFTGSYTFVVNEEEITRDLSGSGSFSMSVQGNYLKRVRVQRVLGAGLVALTVYQNGEVIFESKPTDLPAPILFTNMKPNQN